MKIALCFSGEARSFKQGYEYYKRNLLDRYEIDVYIHSWSFENQNELLELYSPKAYIFDNKPEIVGYNDRYPRTPEPQNRPPWNAFCMFYSMYRSSVMIRDKYDWVIKSRTDYALNTQINFEELDNSKLYIPNCRMVPERDFGNDQFAFSSQDNMLKYMSTYKYIDEYYDDGTVYIGENMVQANLRKHGLCGENLVYVNMNNPFPPGKYNGTWHSLIRDDMNQWVKY
jgi:hypothetical protein